MMMLIGFAALALPTARTAFSFFMRFASRKYVDVAPYGTFNSAFQTLF
jgi:hypothetical protein